MIKLAGLTMPTDGPQSDRDSLFGQPVDTRNEDMTLREFLSSSSFHLNLSGENDGMSRITGWGQFSSSMFRGTDGLMNLDGDVLTGTIGFDSAWKNRVAGMAIAFSVVCDRWRNRVS